MLVPVAPVDPVTPPAQNTTDPVANNTQPETPKPSDNSTEPVKPSDNTTETNANTTEPAKNETQPETPPTEPIVNVIPANATEKEVREFFSSADSDSDGFLTKEEIKNAFSS